MVIVSTDAAPSSSSKPPAPSVTEETATGSAGFVMLIIWTPSSASAATSA